MLTFINAFALASISINKFISIKRNNKV